MKENYLKETLGLKDDSMLYKFLFNNFSSFTLANFVDYIALNDNTKALCHVNRNGIKTELTYKDLSEMSNKMANYLKNKGVRRGDVVALILRNNIEFFGLALALQKLGAVCLPLNYTNKLPQYNSIFNRANPKCIIAEDYEIKQSKNNSVHVLDEINKSVGENAIKICVNPNSCYSKEWDNIQGYTKESNDFDKELVSINDLGYLFSTSGTTGEPKLVMHNYGFALAHLFTGQWYGVKKEEKHYTICDSSWAMASWNMSAVLLHQGILYINDFDRFDARKIVDCILNEKIYSLCAPRSILMNLIKSLESNSMVIKDKIKTLSSAGEPLDAYDRQYIEKHFGTSLREGYGMTEVVLPLYESGDGIKKVSPLYSKVNVEKNDGFDDSEIVIYGEGLGLLMGYLKQKDDYLEYDCPPMIDGQLIWHTSDVGHIDENGNICCDGRFGNTVKVNDCLINKSELENVIKQHPKVFDCVVESHPDNISGNYLTAIVELENGATLTEEEIKNFVKLNMQDYYRPKYVIFGPIERTPNGKKVHKDTSETPDKGMILVRKKQKTNPNN